MASLNTKYMTEEGKKVLISKRKLYGYKQNDIARLLGISICSYSLKETGKNDWKNQERLKLIKYLHLDINEEEIVFN